MGLLKGCLGDSSAVINQKPQFQQVRCGGGNGVEGHEVRYIKCKDNKKLNNPPPQPYNLKVPFKAHCIAQKLVKIE